MISKELLSEVLGVYVRDGWYFDCELLIYTYDKILGLDENYHSQINIYELAHKYKKWAFVKGYFVQSDFLEVNIYPIEYDGSKMKLVHCFDIVPIDCDSYTEEEIDSFPHNETEAIFKACEWILKEMK